MPRSILVLAIRNARALDATPRCRGPASDVDAPFDDPFDGAAHTVIGRLAPEALDATTEPWSVPTTLA